MGGSRGSRLQYKLAGVRVSRKSTHSPPVNIQLTAS